MFKLPIEYVDLALLSGNTGIIMALISQINEDYKPLNNMFIF